jgi:hypothetical protein
LKDEGLEPDSLLSTLQTLSVFRRYGPWLLRALLDRELVQLGIECEEDEEYALEGMLLETYLLERKGGFLQNDISRRLFAIHLRSIEPERFQELCQMGLTLYEDYLHSQNLRRPEIVAVEWIYQEVQYEYHVEGKQGNTLLEGVLEKTRSALEILKTTWDSREIGPDFIAALREDWELQFMVNYFSSEDVYSYEPYGELISSVRESSTDTLGGRDA